eukprot:Amastigsp_a174980_79.p6 type:complete len:136 gc:universal Amastigsp_a174980_79:645-238(-)
MTSSGCTASPAALNGSVVPMTSNCNAATCRTTPSLISMSPVRYGNTRRQVAYVFASQQMRTGGGSLPCIDRMSSSPPRASMCSCVKMSVSMVRTPSFGNQRTACSLKVFPQSIRTVLRVPLPSESQRINSDGLVR